MKRTLTFALAAAMVLPLVACTERGSDDQLRDRPGDVFEENIGEPAEEGVEDAGEAGEKAGDRVEDATN